MRDIYLYNGIAKSKEVNYLDFSPKTNFGKPEHTLTSRPPYYGWQNWTYITPMYNDTHNVSSDKRMINCDNSLRIMVGKAAKEKNMMLPPKIKAGKFL